MLWNFAKVLKRAVIKRLKASKWPICNLTVESARSCNLQCLQCANHAKKVSMGPFSSDMAKGIMSLETFKHITPLLKHVHRVNFDNHGEAKEGYRTSY